MTDLVRKLLVCATVDGLILQPVAPRGSRSTPSSIKISYETNTVTPSLQDELHNVKLEGLEAYGIVGLLKLSSSSYLITISRRDEVAQIRGKPIYTVTDVALIPLSNQQDAEHVIANARNGLKDKANDILDSEDEDNGDASILGEEEHAQGSSPVTPPLETEALEPSRFGASQQSKSFMRDVIKDKGKYGRFADRWLSRGGWTGSGRNAVGMASNEQLIVEQKKQAQEALSRQGIEGPKQESAADVLEPAEAETGKQHAPTSKPQSVTDRLTPRIVRSTKLFFSSSSFFFSYDHNVSKSVSQQDLPSLTVPLFKRFDPLYFWNHNLIEPFIDAGQEGFVLPLIQGFVGQRAFSIAETAGFKDDTAIETDGEQSDQAAALKRAAESLKRERAPKHDFFLTLVSRRSVKRAGLRYLRRGIDDEGNVANNVETEQILSSQENDSVKPVYSLLQTRGSIPLFFSQSPYSFKPLPTQFGSEATNQAAFKQHFASLIARYGDVQVASLVDKHATEAQIGQAFEHHAMLFNGNGGVNGKDIAFEWFDFHAACKGMKFENVSVLLGNVRPSLESFGWTVQRDDKVERTQSGILRTNCMDCLDRTNVAQSAVAGDALQLQLAELALTIDLKTDPTTSWFNTLWADNGDAISKQYAGTAALKGDFTRTRKRNWTGALSDFSLTLNRYYNNIFGDYFLQTCIDYYLGNDGPAVFEDFETNMMSQDYALDMGRIRHNAIDRCVQIVLEDPKEDLVAGWTLSCPHEANTLRSLPFEECVLLLTDIALYFCRFDWNTDKVGSFERIDLLDITEMWYGPYITSVLSPGHMDETKNVGFVVRYKTGGQAMVRTNTRSLHNAKVAEDEEPVVDKATGGPAEDETRLLAFKTLPSKSSASRDAHEDASGLSEVELTQHICGEVKKHAIAAMEKDREAETQDEAKRETFKVQKSDVISVTEAKKSTGYLETFGYSLKKLVWS